MLNTIRVNGKRYTCRVFDSGPEYADRYTIAFRGYYVPRIGMVYPYLAAGDNPFHPQGFGQHGESRGFMKGRHIGKRIPFDALPPDTQKFVLFNIREG